MNGDLEYTEEERRLPKMKCTYGTILHSHVKSDGVGKVSHPPNNNGGLLVKLPMLNLGQPPAAIVGYLPLLIGPK